MKNFKIISVLVVIAYLDDPNNFSLDDEIPKISAIF